MLLKYNYETFAWTQITNTDLKQQGSPLTNLASEQVCNSSLGITARKFAEGNGKALSGFSAKRGNLARYT